MMHEEDIGKLQEEALKRKERLLALKRKRTEGDDGPKEPAPLPRYGTTANHNSGARITVLSKAFN
jgi:hypothetical protein